MNDMIVDFSLYQPGGIVKGANALGNNMINKDIFYGGSGSGGGLIPGIGGMNPYGTTLNLGGDAGKTGGRGSNPMPQYQDFSLPQPLSVGTGITPLPGFNTDNVLPPTLLSNVGAPNLTAFPANTAGTVPGQGLQDLNVGNLVGFNTGDPATIIKQLDDLFGKGLGQVFYNFLSTGAGYNPAVAGALTNQMAPYEERARNNILESFAASGGRYSSPAAIGLGDFESSYALGQQGILANLYNQAVDRYANMFGGILDTAHLEEANKSSIWDKLSNLLGLGNAAAGGKGGGSGSGTSGPLGGIIDKLKNLFSGNKPPTLPGNIPSAGQGTINDIINQIISNPTIPGFDVPGAISDLPINNIPGFDGFDFDILPPGSSNSNIIFDPSNYDPGSLINPSGGIDWGSLFGNDVSNTLGIPDWTTFFGGSSSGSNDFGSDGTGGGDSFDFGGSSDWFFSDWFSNEIGGEEPGGN